ncbi:MAG TPA: ribosome maturation factor RimP [Fibrobacteria bacterium]|nr:ribosome maturation factor RimP [Fibrobacteria bacterium]
MDLIENIAQLATKVAESNGLELVDVEIFRAGKRRVLRIYIGKRDGVNVDDCARVSRDLGTLLDADNVMQDENYILEVSSPGLDRPFKTVKDYRRNLGRFVRVSTREPVEGLGNKRLVVGKLADVGEASITVDTDGTPRSIPLDLIVQARVDVRLT